MKKTILVAGATGNLGQKICFELKDRGAEVRALVRPESHEETVKALQEKGIITVEVDYHVMSGLESACKGVSCVVSALAGLQDAIIDKQAKLLDAAINAGVPRFIPSDFCTDYTQLPEGCNRNFDLRKKFAEIIDHRTIKATSIFNGAFSYILQYDIPLLNPKNKTIGYFDGKSDWKIDFTALEDTAAFTACAALDDTTPRYLRIAGFQVSPEELVGFAEKIYNAPFQLQNIGLMHDFQHTINHIRKENPESENELYPAWQQMQYLYSMFAAHHQHTDNEKYSGISWTGIEEVLKKINNNR